MATDTPKLIPGWHQALLLQIAVAILTSVGFLIFGSVGQVNAWITGALIAAIPHAIYVYYAGRYQNHAGVRKTLRFTQRGLAFKLALTALLFALVFKQRGSSHAVIILLGFAMTTLVGAVYPLLRKARR